MKKIIGLIFGLLPVSASAECVPVPDCASIGYTETGCDGDSLKCPFDTSKLKCFPCDSSFRYTCTGDNITSSVGDACNNKYTACECIDGATFSNGDCICDTSCNTIGNIYYSDGSCSSCNISTKTPVGIVVYKDSTKHLLVNIDTKTIKWAPELTDVPDLTNYTIKENALLDYDGKGNTQIIVNLFGENAEEVAAVYCYNYAPAGWESTKHQWYLPAIGELYASIGNNRDVINSSLQRIGKNTLGTYLWSSTECQSNVTWGLYFNNSNPVFHNGKQTGRATSCFLAI